MNKHPDNEINVFDQQLQTARQLRLEKRVDLALPILRDLAETAPNAADVQLELAYALLRTNQLDEAIAATRQAIEAAPEVADAQTLLVALLIETGRITEAQQEADLLARMLPNWAEAWRLCGEVAYRLNRLLEAKEYLSHAVALRPEFADAQVRLAETLLKLGEYPDGWRLYEWRWQCKGYGPVSTNRVPRWTSTDPLDGRRIVIIAEQGVGDMIQYARYAKLLRERGAEVVITCHASLAPLLRKVEGIGAAIPFGMPLPPVHYQIPLLSLPFAFQTTVASIPSQMPYMRPNEIADEEWAQRIGQLRGRGKRVVGLCWSGHVAHVFNNQRSISLDQLAPLFDVPDVRWISLQAGPRSHDLIAAGTPIVDISRELTNFDETAGAIKACDLVISVDTAVAHLTGALNHRGWLLLHAGCDCRWMAASERTPWYPSLRLYRQEVEGDWSAAIERVAHHLHAFAPTSI